jgi:hypothetical protein
MVEATISRVRLRDLAVWADALPASPRRGEPSPTHPRVASSRPETGDLVASTI